jgi:alpha-1,6-mannosyltransferase
MKICDVTQFYSPVGGGVKRYLSEKRKHIQNNTEDEHVLLVPGEKTEVIREDNLTTCTIASPSVNKSSQYRIIFNLKPVEKFIRQEKPDIIESGDPYHVSWKLIKLGKELHIPVFGYYHSHFPEAYLRTIEKYAGTWAKNLFFRRAQKYILRLYNKFETTLVSSQYLSNLLNDWGLKNINTVHLGVDVNIFCPGNSKSITKKSLNLPEQAQLLLYIGRLSGEKNTSLLLDAFRLLNEEHPNKYAFLIIGDGQLRDLVIQSRKDLPLLRWIPYCQDPQKLADYYRTADLFVHPGVCETFGLVALESQACGRPVVGIKGSYMDANIFAGHNMWSKENTPEGLQKAILRFSKSNLKELGEKASREVRNNFCWSKTFEKLWENYRSAIDKFALQSSNKND